MKTRLRFAGISHISFCKLIQLAPSSMAFSSSMASLISLYSLTT